MRNIIRKHPDFTACLFLSVMVLGMTLPFLNHAYHIDEPLFLRIAQQIKEHPFDPYGFWYLWNAKYEPIYQIAAFSPVFSYFLAGIGWLYHFPPEWLVHLSLIPFALLSVLSLYFLCRQWKFSPFLSFFAAALLTLSPAFVISANLAMPDTAALGLSLVSLVLAIRGWEKDNLGFMLAGGTTLGLAMLMRYNAVPLLPIFFLLGFTYTTPKKAVLPGLMATLIFGIWMAVSTFFSGTAHTSEVISVFAGLNGWKSRFWSMNIHLTLSTFIPLLMVFAWWRKSLFISLLIFFIGIDFAFFAGSKIKQFAVLPDLIFFLLGITTLVLLAILFFQSLRSAKFFRINLDNEPSEIGIQLSLKKLGSLIGNEYFRNIVLILWILGVLAIPIIYVHFASKYLLLMQAPLLLILLSKLSQSKNSSLRYSFFVLPVMGLISLLLARSDFAMANIYRTEAEHIAKTEITNHLGIKQCPLPLVWFTGHWGWQYYMENWGAVALPYEYVEGKGPLPGDLIVTAKFASANNFDPNLAKKLVKIESDEKNIPFPLRSMNPHARAGFYSNHWGPLPFSFSSTPIEEFNVYQLKP